MSVLTLEDFRSELKVRLRDSSLTNAQVDRWANLGQLRLAGDVLPSHLRIAPTFTAVANQREYLLNVSFNRIFSLADTTNDRELLERSEDFIDSLDPDQSETGDPALFAMAGLAWVSNQPSSASAVTIVSSSASDTEEKVRINGVVSSVDDTELLTLNGTTNVVGTKSFSEIHSITKNDSTTGKVTATSNSGAVTLIELAPGEQSHSYQRVILYPVPTATDSYRFLGLRNPRTMVNSEDVPDFPVDFHEACLIAATVIGHRSLYNFSEAEQIETREYFPRREMLQARFSDRKMKRAPVKRSMFSAAGDPDPRLPEGNFNT